MNVMDNAEKINFKAKRLEKLVNLYGEEDAYRYIDGNKQTDKLADKIYDTSITETPNITKYHNKYILKSNRKKTTKKRDKNLIINTRVRKTIKETIRNDFSEEVWKKDKYNNIKQYKESINKMSIEILRDKSSDRESGRKMMMRMIHGTLPTCEKINKLVQIEKSNGRSSTFYKDKYERHTNERLCPCCLQETETIRYLFFECEHSKLIETREQLESQVQKAVNKHVDKIHISTKFVGIVTANNNLK